MTGEPPGIAPARAALTDHGARGRAARASWRAPPAGSPPPSTSARAAATRLASGRCDGEHRDRAACGACGFIAYINPRLVVTTIPVTDDGRVMLLRRAIEPGYGAWAQPGGFLEADETAIEGAIRETREETGLDVEPLGIVGLYSRPQAAIVVVAFEARIVGGRHDRDAGGARGAAVRARRHPMAGRRVRHQRLGAVATGSGPPTRSSPVRLPDRGWHNG